MSNPSTDEQIFDLGIKAEIIMLGDIEKKYASGEIPPSVLDNRQKKHLDDIERSVSFIRTTLMGQLEALRRYRERHQRKPTKKREPLF